MVSFPHLQSEIYYGHCLAITIPNGDKFYYQNFQVESFFYQGVSWLFLPFEASSVSNTVELSNTSASINLANIAVVRDIIKEEVRESRITLITIFPDDDNLSIEFNGVLSGYTINKNVINFQITSAIDAVSGSIPSTDLNPIDFPILAYINLTRNSKIRN